MTAQPHAHLWIDPCTEACPGHELPSWQDERDAMHAEAQSEAYRADPYDVQADIDLERNA